MTNEEFKTEAYLDAEVEAAKTYPVTRGMTLKVCNKIYRKRTAFVKGYVRALILNKEKTKQNDSGTKVGEDTV